MQLIKYYKKLIKFRHSIKKCTFRETFKKKTR